MATLRSILTCLLLAVCIAAVAPVAWEAWQHRDDIGGAAAGLRLLTDRAVAAVAEVPPILRESAETVKAARGPLSEAAQTVRAARPVLSAAKAAIERTAPVLRAAEGSIVELGKLRADLRPTIADANELVQQASSTVAMIRPQALGMTAASKITAGNAAKITGEAAKVAPTVTASVAQITTDGRKIVHRAASPWNLVVDVLKKVKNLIF